MENPRTVSPRRPLIIAHRGASATAPENTLAAFSRALREGADGLELDVRLACDGVPVVIHDATLRRTGLGAGVVADMTSVALGCIDVGRWFCELNPNLAVIEEARQFIPTLEQVFELCADTNSRQGTVIYVEMKTDQAENTYLELSEAIVQLIERYSFQDRAIAISFDLRTIAHIKTSNPSIMTGALFDRKRHGFARKKRLVGNAVAAGADEILLHRLLAGHGIFELATKRKLRSVVWTVDDPRWLSRAVSSGIHALITNDPAGLVGEEGLKC